MSGRAPRPTGLEWLLLGVGLVLTLHYAWILDDAYVYFRYVDNFVDYGFGWVYNQGEFVEGYTSALWLVLLTALRELGIDYWWMVRGLGVLSFAGFWWGLVWLDRDLSPGRGEGPDRRRIVNLPLLFLAPNYATLTYFTSGVESPFVQLAAVAYALFLVRPSRPVAGAIVGLSPLVRPELALAWILALGFALYRTRRVPWWAVGVGVVVPGSWLVFRIYYYADLVPNTFYLKHEEMIGQGFAYLHQSLASYGVYPLAVLALVAVVALRRRAVSLDALPRIAMLVVAVAIASYFVRIGGDPRHHRYLAFSFCLAAGSLAGLPEHVLRTFAPGLGGARLAALAVVVAFVFASLYPPQLSGHPIFRDITNVSVDLINDAEFHRKRPGLMPPPWSLDGLEDARPPELLERRASWRSGYDDWGTSLWCVDNYWNIDQGVIHGAGLTDAVLSRIPAESTRPAHKPALRPRARVLADLRERDGQGVGKLRQAATRGDVPSWIGDNLETLELIERKIYNRHDFLENLGLALTPVPEIVTRRARGQSGT